MNTINFEPIGKAMKAFDSDKMNIGRRTEIVNPDGTTNETDPQTPLYSDVPCHISFQQIDNPDPNTAETRPINKILKISCATSVDLQNGDFITANKLANDGTLIEQYIGIIGQPSTSMSRQTAEMLVRENI